MALIENDHTEGPIAKFIESQTSKIPSDMFLWTALGAIAGAAILKATGHKQSALFIGQWVAPFLLFGIYNKLVKQQGHDTTDQQLDTRFA